MKTEWICSWQYIPGRKVHFETYATLDEARRAMAKVLTAAVDLSGYIQSLRKEEGADCGSSADFLEKLLTNLTIPESEAMLPKHDDIPEHCLLEFGSDDDFRWSYMRGECPYLTMGYVCEGKAFDPYVISFNYDNPASIRHDRVNAVEIRIYEHINYGSSAHPLMVYLTLGEEPATQEQIARRISQNWYSTIERKAVGRHLQLLRDLGFPVQHGPKGYYYGGEAIEPRPDMKYDRSAYPFLVLYALENFPKPQTAIIQQIREEFGVKISRNAVIRHLELLASLGFRVEKCDNGYYIGK